MPGQWNVYAVVGRASMGLGDLVITNTADLTCPYVIGRNGFGPGSVQWRKKTVESPFVNGRFVVSQVKDAVSMTLSVRVKGASFDWLDYHVQQLVNAMSQFDYSVTWTINGVTHTYRCEAADWAIGEGGVIQDLEARSWTQMCNFVVPRQPVPLAGRF